MAAQRQVAMAEQYTRMLHNVPSEVPRAARAQVVEQRRAAIVEVERQLGRTLEPQEGIALLQHFGGMSEGGRPRAIDPQLGAELLRGYDSYVQQQVSRMPAEYQQALDELSMPTMRVRDSEGRTRTVEGMGRPLEPGEVLAIMRQYPERLPPAGEVARFLERSQALGAREGEMTSQLSPRGQQEYRELQASLARELGRPVRLDERVALLDHFRRVPTAEEAVPFLDQRAAGMRGGRGEEIAGEVLSLSRYAQEVHQPSAPAARPPARHEGMRERTARVEFSVRLMQEHTVESADGQSFVLVRGDTAVVFGRESATEASNAVFYADRVLRGEGAMSQVPVQVRGQVERLISDSEFRGATIDADGAPLAQPDRRLQLSRALAETGAAPALENLQQRVDRLVTEASAHRAAGRYETARAAESEYVALRRAARGEAARQEEAPIPLVRRAEEEPIPLVRRREAPSARPAEEQSATDALVRRFEEQSGEETSDPELIALRRLAGGRELPSEPETRGAALAELADQAIDEVNHLRLIFIEASAPHSYGDVAPEMVASMHAIRDSARQQGRTLSEFDAAMQVVNAGGNLPLPPDGSVIDRRAQALLQRHLSGEAAAGREDARMRQLLEGRELPADAGERAGVLEDAARRAVEDVFAADAIVSRDRTLSAQAAGAMRFVSPQHAQQHDAVFADVSRFAGEVEAAARGRGVGHDEVMQRIVQIANEDLAAGRRLDFPELARMALEQVSAERSAAAEERGTAPARRAVGERAPEQVVSEEEVRRQRGGEIPPPPAREEQAVVGAEERTPPARPRAGAVEEARTAGPRARGRAPVETPEVQPEIPAHIRRPAEERQRAIATRGRVGMVRDADALRRYSGELARQERGNLDALARARGMDEGERTILAELYGQGGTEGRLTALDGLGVDVGPMRRVQERAERNSAEIPELERRVGGFPQRGEGRRTQEVRERIAALDSELRTLEGGSEQHAVRSAERVALQQELRSLEIQHVTRMVSETRAEISALPEGSGRRAGLEAELGALQQELQARERLQSLSQERDAFDRNVQSLFDMVTRGDLEGVIRGREGFADASIERVTPLTGMRGAFMLEMSNGRRLFLKVEDLAPARFGGELARAEGLISSEIIPGHSYETGLVVDGEPVRQEFGLLEDMHDFARGPDAQVEFAGETLAVHRGQRVEGVRLPSGETEAVTVLGVAMLGPEVLETPDPANPAARAFFRLAQTPEGRRQLFEAWRAYQEMSRRALLMDRFTRNTAAVLVQRENGEVSLTFQPIDMDGIGSRIEGEGGGPDFSAFDNDFARASAGFINQMRHAFSRAARIETADGRPLYDGAVHDARTLHDEMFSEPQPGRGAALAPDARDTETGVPRASDRSHAMIRDHDGQPVGLGFDTSSGDVPGVGETIAQGGRRRVVEREDGRVTMYADEMVPLMDEAARRQEVFMREQRRAVAEALRITPIEPAVAGERTPPARPARRAAPAEEAPSPRAVDEPSPQAERTPVERPGRGRQPQPQVDVEGPTPVARAADIHQLRTRPGRVVEEAPTPVVTPVREGAAPPREVTMAERLAPHMNDLLPLLHEANPRSAIERVLSERGFQQPEIDAALTELMAPRNSIEAPEILRQTLERSAPLLEFGSVIEALASPFRRTSMTDMDAGMVIEPPGGFTGNRKARDRARERAVTPEAIGQTIDGFRSAAERAHGPEFLPMSERLGNEAALLERIGRMSPADRMEFFERLRNEPAELETAVSDSALRDYVRARPERLELLFQTREAIRQAESLRARVHAIRDGSAQPDAAPAIGEGWAVVRNMQAIIGHGFGDVTFRVASSDGRVTYNIRITPDAISHIAEGHPEARTPEALFGIIRESVGAQPHGRRRTEEGPLPQTMTFGEFLAAYRSSEDVGMAFSRMREMRDERPGFNLMAVTFDTDSPQPVRTRPDGSVEVDLNVASVYTKANVSDATYSRATIVAPETAEGIVPPARVHEEAPVPDITPMPRTPEENALVARAQDRESRLRSPEDIVEFAMQVARETGEDGANHQLLRRMNPAAQSEIDAILSSRAFGEQMAESPDSSPAVLLGRMRRADPALGERVDAAARRMVGEGTTPPRMAAGEESHDDLVHRHALELRDLAEAWTSGNPERRDAVLRHLQAVYGDSPEMQRLVWDSMQFLEAAGFSDADQQSRNRLAIWLADSLAAPGEARERMPRAAYERLAADARRFVYDGAAMPEIRNAAEARAFGHLVAGMRTARARGESYTDAQYVETYFREMIAEAAPARFEPERVPGITREGEAFRHSDIPGIPFSHEMVQRAAQVAAVARGEPMPAGMSEQDAALARRMRADMGLRRADEQAHTRAALLALELQGRVESQLQTSETLRGLGLRAEVDVSPHPRRVTPVSGGEQLIAESTVVRIRIYREGESQPVASAERAIRPSSQEYGEGVAHSLNIQVAEGLRGRGLANAMNDAVGSAFSDMGVHTVYLFAERDGLRAWPRQGYRWGRNPSEVPAAERTPEVAALTWEGDGRQSVQTRFTEWARANPERFDAFVRSDETRLFLESRGIDIGGRRPEEVAADFMREAGNSPAQYPPEFLDSLGHVFMIRRARIPERPVDRQMRASIEERLRGELERNPRAAERLREQGIELQVRVTPRDDGSSLVTIYMVDRQGEPLDFTQRSVYHSEAGGESLAIFDWMGVPEQLRGVGMSDVLNNAIDSTISDMGVERVYMLAAHDGLLVWPRRGYRWANDSSELPSIDRGERSLRTRTWQGEEGEGIQSSFVEWARAHPDEFTTFLRGRGMRSDGDVSELARGFLEQTGNEPSRYPPEFLQSFDQVPMVRRMERPRAEAVPEERTEPGLPAAVRVEEEQSLRGLVASYEMHAYAQEETARGRHPAVITTPESEMMAAVIGDPASLPPRGTPEREQALRQAAQEVLAEIRAAERFAADYQEFRSAPRGVARFLPEGLFEFLQFAREQGIDVESQTPSGLRNAALGFAIRRRGAARAEAEGAPVIRDVMRPSESAPAARELYDTIAAAARDGRLPAQSDAYAMMVRSVALAEAAIRQIYRQRAEAALAGLRAHVTGRMRLISEGGFEPARLGAELRALQELTTYLRTGYETVAEAVRSGSLDEGGAREAERYLDRARTVSDLIERTVPGAQERADALRAMRGFTERQLARALALSDRSIGPAERSQRLARQQAALDHLAAWAMLRRDPATRTMRPRESPEITARVRYLELLATHGDPAAVAEYGRRLIRTNTFGADISPVRPEETMPAVQMRLLESVRNARGMTQERVSEQVLERAVLAAIDSIERSAPELFRDAGLDPESLRQRASGGQHQRRDALADLNRVLMRRGMAVLESDGRISLYSVTHTARANGLEDTEALIVNPVHGEPRIFREHSGGYFDPHMNMIVIRGEEILGPGGRSLEEWIDVIYPHELQHQLDDAAGIASLARMRHAGNPTEANGWIEATAIARETLSLLEGRGDVAALRERVRRAGERGDYWARGYQIVLSAFTDEGGRPVTDPAVLRARLSSVIDDGYRNLTNGISFSDIFEMRTSGEQNPSIDEFLSPGVSELAGTRIFDPRSPLIPRTREVRIEVPPEAAPRGEPVRLFGTDPATNTVVSLSGRDRNEAVAMVHGDLLRYAADPPRMPADINPTYASAVRSVAALPQSERTEAARRFASHIVDTSGIVRPGTPAEMEESIGRIRNPDAAFEAVVQDVSRRGRSEEEASSVRSVARVLDALANSPVDAAQISDPAYRQAVVALRMQDRPSRVFRVRPSRRTMAQRSVDLAAGIVEGRRGGARRGPSEGPMARIPEEFEAGQEERTAPMPRISPITAEEVLGMSEAELPPGISVRRGSDGQPVVRTDEDGRATIDLSYSMAEASGTIRVPVPDDEALTTPGGAQAHYIWTIRQALRMARFEAATEGWSVRMVAGGEQEQVVSFGGREGLPVREYPAEQFGRAIQLAEYAERLHFGEIQRQEIPVELRGMVDVLLANPAFTRETRRAAASGDRYAQLAMVVERLRISERFAEMTEPRTPEDALMTRAIDARASGGRSRGEAAFEAVSAALADAIRISSMRARPDEPLAAFAYDAARAHASANGRSAPIQEDFLFAALARTSALGGTRTLDFRTNGGVLESTSSPGERPHVDIRFRTEGGAEYRVRVFEDGFRIVDGSGYDEVLGRHLDGAGDAVFRLVEARNRTVLEEALRPVMEHLRQGNIGTASRVAPSAAPLAPGRARPPPIPRMGGPAIFSALAAGTPSPHAQRRALMDFTHLSTEAQETVIAQLHQHGRHEQAAWLSDLRAMNGRAGHDLERAYSGPPHAVRPGELSEIYMTADSLSEARTALASRLGIALDPLFWANVPMSQRDTQLDGFVSPEYRRFNTLADDGFFFGMLTSGDLAGAVRERFPDGRIISARYLNGLVGAYMLRVRDSNGREHVIFLKRQDLRPDRAGSEYSQASGVPAAWVVTSRPREEQRITDIYHRWLAGNALDAGEMRIVADLERIRADLRLSTSARDVGVISQILANRMAGLRYTMPDGSSSGYGFIGNIRDFEGPLRIAGREMQTRTLSAASVGDLHTRPELLDHFFNDSRAFWEELGFALAGSYATGLFDRHEGNVWVMRVELVNPGAQDLAAIGYRRTPQGGIEVIPGRTPARTLEMDAQGRITMVSIGGIDTDTGGVYLAAARPNGTFSFSQMVQRFGSQDLHRFFVSLTRLRNAIEAQAAQAEGREPVFISPIDLAYEAFGEPPGSGALFTGLRRWMGEFGLDQAYRNDMVRRFANHGGEPAGMGQTILPQQSAMLTSDGVAYSSFRFNGEEMMPIFTPDGRSVLGVSYELANAGALAPDVLAMFPHGRQVFVVPLSPQRAASIPGSRTIGGRTFAVFQAFESVPADLRSHVVPAMRHHGILRAADGFSAATGIASRGIGAERVFRHMMGRGTAGMDADFAQILGQLRAAEHQEEQRARAEPERMPRHLGARLPPGYGEDRLPPLR
ncbi:MAG: hypothetical protein AB1324_05570 [Candidatus Micrarchaeota archaeon]